MAKKRKPNANAVKLLRAAKQMILANPDNYRQDEWHCGSACCIAGQVAMAAGAYPVKLREGEAGTMVVLPVFNLKVVRSSSDNPSEAWPELAERLMRLNPFRTDSLFSSKPNKDWPAPFNAEWRKADTRKAKAQVAASRIEHFIRTGE